MYLYTNVLRWFMRIKIVLYEYVWLIFVIVTDNYVENNEHYFLHCKLFVNQRNVMLNNIRDLGLDISINNILYGNSDFTYDVNCSLFAAVHKYILDTKRFV